MSRTMSNTNVSHKKILSVALWAATGAAAAFGAVAIASSAAKLPEHRAAQTHAVPLVLAVVMAGTSLMTAAAAATDE